MRTEVFDWVATQAKELKPKGPVLEVGALNVNGGVRDLFPQKGYVGLDLVEGDGVDRVGNILDECSPELAGSFNTVVCCETLEHVTDPRLAIKRMNQYTQPGGLFIGTWVLHFPIHHEPDYWRATPEGFHLLLEAAGYRSIKVATQGKVVIEPKAAAEPWRAEGPIGIFATARRSR
jgi:SAM-dependent methyltransferase